MVVRRKKLLILRLSDFIPLPTYAHSGDAGLDLSSAEKVTLRAGQWQAVRTGLAIQLPPETEGQIRPRSGLARDHGITVLNSPGTIDAGYRGEVVVLLVNFGRKSFVVDVGMKIAQLVIAPVVVVEISEVQTLEPSTRGKCGFGSTGSKITRPVKRVRS